MQISGPIPFKEGQRLIADKSAVTRAVFDQLPDEIQAMAFTVSGIQSFDVLQRIQDLVASVPAGRLWKDAKDDLIEELDAAGIKNSEKRAELLLRTHVFRTYAAANHRLSVAHADAFPFCQYISTNDGKVRHSHRALHDKIFPATHPFWTNHTGPWEWGCRCEKVSLTLEEVAEMEAEDAKKNPEKRRVVSGAILRAVETTGELWSAPPPAGVEATARERAGFYDIRTPREKSGDPADFEWRAGDVGLSLETIKNRYSPDVWAIFEKALKRGKTASGRSVWDVLNGTPRNVRAGKLPGAAEAPKAPEKAPEKPKAPEPAGPEEPVIVMGPEETPAPVKPAPVKPTPVKPAPVKPVPVKPVPVKPVPVKPVPVNQGTDEPVMVEGSAGPDMPGMPATPAANPRKPRGTPLSGKLTLPGSGVVHDSAAAALRMMEATHGDGGLLVSPVKSVRRGPLEQGKYVREFDSEEDLLAGRISSSSIEVNKNSSARITTVLHETGHKLDVEGVRTNAQAMTTRDRLIRTLLDTDTMRAVAAREGWPEEHRKYMALPEEVLARAYVQYIATEGRMNAEDRQALDAEMRATRAGKGVTDLDLWTDEEFAAALPLFRQMFTEMGWME